MNAQRVVAIAGLAVATWLGASAQAQACSCLAPTPESYEASDAAVIAELIDVRHAPGSFTALFVFELDRVLKGAHRIDRPRLVIRSSANTAACGLSHARRRYGLLLDRVRGRWSASLCTQMGPDALRALARGEDPYERPYC